MSIIEVFRKGSSNELPLPQLQTRLVTFRLEASDRSGLIVFLS